MNMAVEAASRPTGARGRVGRLAVLGTALALAVGVLAVQAPTPGEAAVPSVPPSNSSIITVKVGGVRTGSAIVGPVAGVVLRLLDGTNATPGAAIAQPWATCTSDADGDCSFVVPDTGTSGANRDKRFFIEQVSAPGGWRGDPSVVTSSNGNTFAQTAYTVRTGTQLRAGQTYASTSNFMINATGVQASSGIWPESMDNPPLPNACGLNVALLMDLSYSVQESGSLPQLRAAASGLTQALVGTSSQVALYTFGTSAPAGSPNNGNNANRPLTPVSTQANADIVKGWIAGITIPTPAESTNWDRGLWQIAQSPGGTKSYDLAIIITDGNPTRYGPGTGAASPSNGIATRFAELEQAVFSANAVKALGTRVIAVGVGSGVSASALNLAAISGPTAGSDYYTVGWQDAAATLQSLALSGCADAAAKTGSLTIIKNVMAYGSNNTTTATPQGGWTMTASSTRASIDGAGQASGQTAFGTGAVSFSVDFGANPTADVLIDENVDAQPPPLNSYTHVATACSLLTPTGTTPLATAGAGAAFTVTIKPGDIASCVVYNRASDPNAATLRVDKVWDIDGTRYDDGAQPMEFSSSYSIADGADLSWGHTYTGLQAGASIIVKEKVSLPDGCNWAWDTDNQAPSAPGGPAAVLSGVQLERLDPATGATQAGPFNLAAPVRGDLGYTATGYPDTLIAGQGQNRWRVTNHITCEAQLILAKVVNSDAGHALPALSPFDWTLTATDDATGVPTTPGFYVYPTCDQVAPGEPCYAPGEPYAVARPIPVDPLDSFTLSEASDAAGADAYVRSGPWTCYGVDPVAGEFLGPVYPGAAGDQVQIPYGVPVVECVAINSTAELSATKRVVGGSAQPGEWTYSLTPVAPDDAPAVADGAWGAAGRVRPLQRYTLSESDGPAGYELTDLRCTWDGPDSLGGEIVAHADVSVIADPTLTLAPDSTASCTFVNTALTSLTLVKTAADVPDPLVAGSTFTYLLAVTAGAADATDVSVSDPVPSGLEVVDVRTDAGGWTVGHAGNAVTATAASVTGGATVTIEVQVRVGAGYVSGVLTNTACATAGNVPDQSCDTVTVPQTPPRLTLAKRVDGGPAAPADWTLSASGPTPITGASGSAGVTRAEVSAGAYALSESGGPAWYTARGWACVAENGSDVSVTDDSVALVDGDDVTCVATNEYTPPPPKLTLVKVVDGGSAQPSDWTLTAVGPESITGASGVTGELASGLYALSESDGPANYASRGWACVTRAGETVPMAAGRVGLAGGDDVTCTVTNTYVEPPPTPSPSPSPSDPPSSPGTPVTASPSDTPSPSPSDTSPSPSDTPSIPPGTPSPSPSDPPPSSPSSPSDPSPSPSDPPSPSPSDPPSPSPSDPPPSSPPGTPVTATPSPSPSDPPPSSPSSPSDPSPSPSDPPSSPPDPPSPSPSDPPPSSPPGTPVTANPSPSPSDPPPNTPSPTPPDTPTPPSTPAPRDTPTPSPSNTPTPPVDHYVGTGGEDDYDSPALPVVVAIICAFGAVLVLRASWRHPRG